MNLISLMASKPKSHPDATYLKQDEVGLVLAKAMAHTYRAQPANPIDYFAKWLLNHSEVQKQHMRAEESLQAKKEVQEQYISDQRAAKKKAAAQPNDSAKRENKVEAFTTRINQSSDLADEL